MRRPSAINFLEIVIFDPVFPFFWLFIPPQGVTTYRRFWPSKCPIWVYDSLQNSHKKKLFVGRRGDNFLFFPRAPYFKNNDIFTKIGVSNPSAENFGFEISGLSFFPNFFEIWFWEFGSTRQKRYSGTLTHTYAHTPPWTSLNMSSTEHIQNKKLPRPSSIQEFKY